MGKHSTKKNSKCAKPTIACDCMPPWSETRETPDAQWCPITPIITPPQKVDTPLYVSSEDPAPQWVPNVLLNMACPKYDEHKKDTKEHKKELKHHMKEIKHRMKDQEKTLKKGHLLRSCRHHDNIIGYVYGTNPFSNTVNAGGNHFQ